MSEDRKMGFMWGFCAGASAISAIHVHPGMIVFTALAIFFNIYFSRK